MAKGMAGMMKQAQKLQAKLAKVQEELADKQVEGSSGGGMVVVTANGQQDILAIKISPEVLDPEDVDMLEDLVMAAMMAKLFSDTKRKELFSGIRCAPRLYF